MASVRKRSVTASPSGVPAARRAFVSAVAARAACVSTARSLGLERHGAFVVLFELVETGSRLGGVARDLGDARAVLPGDLAQQGAAGLHFCQTFGIRDDPLGGHAHVVRGLGDLGLEGAQPVRQVGER